MKRPADGDMDRTAYCDISAYEKQPISVGGIVDPVDLSGQQGETPVQTVRDSSEHDLVLWVGSASVLVIAAGVLASRRRRHIKGQSEE